MASLVSRARATALTATLGALYVSAAVAADMPFPSQPAPVNQALEFGTGWYLRGDIGYSNMSVPVVVADFANSLGRTGAVAGGIGFGYQYNSWFRTDFTVDRAVFNNNRQASSVWCPYSAHPESSQGSGGSTSVKLGGGQDLNETCTPVVQGGLTRTSPMFNAYVDLGNWWGLTPYIGAGVGASLMQSTSSVTYFKNSDGSPYTADLSAGMDGYPLVWVSKWTGATIFPQPNIPFAPVNWNQSVHRDSWKFAWNVMAGVSYDISQNLKIDVHYRFLDAGSYTSLPGLYSGAGPITKDMFTHEIRVGFRLTSD